MKCGCISSTYHHNISRFHSHLHKFAVQTESFPSTAVWIDIFYWEMNEFTPGCDTTLSANKKV